VPYLKFARDKRGYEYFSIVEAGVARRGRPPRPRVLFWFRTPPQVKVGRHPFTDEIRREIEERNPTVRFDWPRLLATPIPPPDVEHWRERRRAEKAAKQAARDAERTDLAEPSDIAAQAEFADQAELAAVGPEAIEATLPDASPGGLDAATGEDDVAASFDGELEQEEDEDLPDAGDAQTAPAAGSSEPVPAALAAQPGARRKRRRRRRRPHTADASPAATPAPPDGPETPTEEV